MGYEMASTGRQLYLWDGRALWAADPDRETEGEAEAALQFEAVSGDIGLTETDDKYISRITLRLDAQTHSVVTLAASYDGGPWETLRTAAATGDHARLNLPLSRAGTTPCGCGSRAPGRSLCGSMAFYAGRHHRRPGDRGRAEKVRDEHGEFSGAERHRPAQLWQQHGPEDAGRCATTCTSCRNSWATC